MSLDILRGKRIAVLTTGHLATSPRMTKAADAFAEAGATVHVVSTRSTGWAVIGDADIIRRRPGMWQWQAVDYRRESRAVYLKSGSRQKLALQIARRMNPARLPLYVAASARERVFPEIVAAARRLNVDFVYGGGAGLAAAFFSGKVLGVPFGLDLEDFHTGDQDRSPTGRLIEKISARIESEVLPKAALRTAGSSEIAMAYERAYGLDFITIDNAFSTDGNVRARAKTNQPLRLYWFSQTIGPGRGLEDAINAAGISGIAAELHLQGGAADPYLGSLMDLARRNSPRLEITHHEPCMPDDVVAECAKYDVGLALELPDTVNRDLCLTNKALAYVAAGMAVALTDTRGQRALASDLGEGGFSFRPGDSQALAKQLAKWDRNRAALQSAMDATYAAATKRWNWNNPAEKPRLIESVAHFIGAAR